MKLVVILSCGRSGSDLLQSLFDWHPQIAQFPGVIRFEKPFSDIFYEKDPKKISEMFCDLYPSYFDSRAEDKVDSHIERHDMLGKNKNEFYKLNKNIFKKFFIFYYNASKKKKFDILVSLHKAYTRASKKTLNKRKVIILQVHHMQNFQGFMRIFKTVDNLKILLTLRDPLVSLCSSVNHWKIYKSGKDLYAESLYDIIKNHINAFNYYHTFRKKISIVQLEHLHLKSNKVLKNLCKLIKIKYQPSLKKSTYFNKSWWGDGVSKKFLDGLNPKFKNNFDNKIFFNKDIEIIENKIKDIIINYNYPIRSTSKRENRYTKFLPFKFELIVWFHSFKMMNVNQLIKIPYYYLKRLIIFSHNNLYNKNKLPHSIGSSN